jgi:hypothetical protein
MASAVGGLESKRGGAAYAASGVPSAAEIAKTRREEAQAKNIVNREILGCTAMITMFNAGARISEADFISSRGNYFQGTFIALICTVYNFVVTLIFSIAALCCLLQKSEMNFLAKKFLVVTAASFATIGAGLVGTFYPPWAEAYIGKDGKEGGVIGFFQGHAVGLAGFLGSSASGGQQLGGGGESSAAKPRGRARYADVHFTQQQKPRDPSPELLGSDSSDV